MNADEMIQAIKNAENLRNHGRLLETYQLYRYILSERLFASVEFMAEDLFVIQSLADLTILFGDIEAADNLLNGAVELYQNANNIPLANFTLLRRMHLALDRGLLRQADLLLRSLEPQIGNIENIQFSPSGLQQWESGCLWLQSDSKEQSILFSELYLVMGRLLCALGQYGDALTSLNRGLFHGKNLTSELDIYRVLHLKFTIASAYLEQGELSTAKEHLNLLKSDFDEKKQPEAFIRWLEFYGKINLLCGNLGKALKQFQQVQDICNKSGFKRAVLIATFNLAHVLIFLNQTSLAKDYLMTAKTDAEAFQDPILINRANLLLHLADARGQSLVMGNPGFSVKQIRQGKLSNANNDDSDDSENNNSNENQPFLSTQSSNYLAFFEDRVLAFYWYLSRFDLEKANQRLSIIQQTFLLSDSQLIHQKIKILEGILAYYYGVENPQSHPDKIRSAALTFEQVIPYLQQLDLKPELWQVQRFYIWCLSRLNSSAEILEDLTKENDNLLTEMTESLSPQYQAIYLLNKWTADEEYLATQITQIQRLKAQIKKKILTLPWQYWLLLKRLHKLLERIDKYKDVLAKRQLKNQEIPFTETLPKLSLIKRLLTHPRDRITLSFLVLPDRVIVITTRSLFDFSWFKLNFKVLPITRLQLRNLVQNWHKNIGKINDLRDMVIEDKEKDMGVDEQKRDLDIDVDEERENIEGNNSTIAQKISNLLQIDSLLEKLPKRIKKLTIIADDILHGFPFSTLIYQGKYLIEKYGISLAYESNYQQYKSQSSSVKKETLLVGVAQGQGIVTDLLNVEPEINNVSNWLNQHNILSPIKLMNNDAKKADIKSYLKKSCFFHLASHGTFEYNSPDKSGFVLIVDSKKEIFSLREISELDLTGLRHATLSSCWLADHYISPGRWVISLPETFWRSGTESILGCLWQVNDQVAVSFMNRFYEYLDEHPRDEALHLTQLDCLNKKLPNCDYLDTQKPIYWSGFNLYGNYSKLKL